jgi:hypothetical protein
LTIAPDDSGCAIFGPYATLPPGKWTAQLIMDQQALNTGHVFIDVVDKHGAVVIAPERQYDVQFCQVDFTIEHQLDRVEVRVRCPKDTQLSIQALRIGLMA